MSHFTATIAAAGTIYPSPADTVIPFEARKVVLQNQDNTNPATVRFGTSGAPAGEDEVTIGPSGELTLEPFGIGEKQPQAGFTCEVRIRAAAGTPSVIVTAVR